MCRGRVWSEKELDYLERYWGVKSIDYFSKKFQRSNNAISAKATKLGLRFQSLTWDGVTVNDIILALGLTIGGTSYNKLYKLGLPVEISSSLQKRKVKVVQYDMFWEWLRNHQELINIDKFEEYSLGTEPIWMKNLRKAKYEERWKE